MALAPLHLFKLKQLSIFLFMLPSKITYDQKNSKAKNVKKKNASLIFQATFGRRKGVLGQGNHTSSSQKSLYCWHLSPLLWGENSWYLVHVQ